MENKIIKITLASSNPHKLEEINAINTNKNIIFETVKGEFNPDETGGTFEENAIIKAKAASKISKTYCLADDSGLCVHALEGRPGIYSSRYATNKEQRIEKLLNELKGVPFEKRGAHFTCAMVLVDENGDIIYKETGRIFGYITKEAKGENGFGYDPIFFIKELNKTMAELEEDKKNKISHRAIALRAMIKRIEKNF